MSVLKYFDAHAHTQNGGGFARSDLTLCNGTGPGDWQKVLDAARADRGTLPCFGLHPWFIGSAGGGWLEKLESFLERQPRSCVGEIGLDAVKGTDAAAQEEAFTAQLRLAKKLNRPACLHCVGAYDRMLAIIKDVRPGTFMLHAYSGPTKTTENFAALGAYFSFGAAFTDPSRINARRALFDVPPARLLFETESSDPPDLRALIPAAAELTGRSVSELAELSWINGNNFLAQLSASRSAGASGSPSDIPHHD